MEKMVMVTVHSYRKINQWKLIQLKAKWNMNTNKSSKFWKLSLFQSTKLIKDKWLIPLTKLYCFTILKGKLVISWSDLQPTQNVSVELSYPTKVSSRRFMAKLKTWKFDASRLAKRPRSWKATLSRSRFRRRSILMFRNSQTFWITLVKENSSTKKRLMPLRKILREKLRNQLKKRRWKMNDFRVWSWIKYSLNKK